MKFIWKLKNLKYSLRGNLEHWLARKVAGLTGRATLTSELGARLIREDGKVIDYGVIGRRVVTDAFEQFLVDQLQAESSEIGDFKFHDSGVGVTGAAGTDTDIETTDGESRVTGSQTEGATADIYKSVGTISYTTTKAITEHGLFSQATGGTMMDRNVFSALNVVNGDGIEFTYQLTIAGS